MTQNYGQNSTGQHDCPKYQEKGNNSCRRLTGNHMLHYLPELAVIPYRKYNTGDECNKTDYGFDQPVPHAPNNSDNENKYDNEIKPVHTQ